MKSNLIALLAVASLGLVACGSRENDGDVIRIGVEAAYPPFSYVSPSGELTGFDIDIANALCEAMGAECVFVQQDWDGMIPALMARKFDAIVASMSITEERKQRVAFTQKYYDSPGRFARRKGSGIEIDRSSLAGKTVGVQRSTIYDNFITDEFGDDIEIRRYASQDEAYLDAAAGRIDLLMADSIAMRYGFLSRDAGKDWEFVGPDYRDAKYFGEGAAIAIQKQNTALVERFNAAIDTIRSNGTFQAINDRYFDFDIGGD